MASFSQKPWVNPFGKMSISRLFELLVFMAQKGVCSLQNIVKDILLEYIAKKKVGKMAIFGPKPWVNPFGKMSIFRVFQLLVFIAQKSVFSFQNIIKDIFLAYITFKKNIEKQPIFEQNHGLTPLEKCRFFGLFQLLVFIAQKGAFSFQNIIKHVFLAHIAQK